MSGRSTSRSVFSLREIIVDKKVRNILYGFLAWFIPFASAFLFYTSEGKLRIDIFLFKSIMIVVGSISAAILLVSYFKKINGNYLIEGVSLGFTWLVISLGLDLLVLVPMSGMSVPEYFGQIGLRYVVIPVFCITIGIVLKNNGQINDS